jgi:hypothetical protein
MIVAKCPEKLAKDKYSIRSHGFLGVFRFFFRFGSTPLGLEVAHRELKISPAQFDEVAAELRARGASFGQHLEHQEGERWRSICAHVD